MRVLLYLLSVSFCLSSPLFAQSTSSYDRCIKALDQNDLEQVLVHAKTIKGKFNVAFVNREKGEKCLEAAFGENFAYSRKKLMWVSGKEATEVEAAAKAQAAKIEAQAMAKEAVRLRVCEVRELITKHDKTINEAEAARQDRRIETLSATVQECRSWFDESPREALTNDVCNPIFAAGGLPNSTIAGPSQSELLLAELSKKNAERELEVLYASGMLLEDFIAQYPSKEVDDRYNCDK